MGYAPYETYAALYGTDGPSEADYSRLSWEADRELDRQTTGLDNVRKLKTAFPAEPDGAEAVRRCACALVRLLYQIEQVEQSIQSTRGYIRQEDGSVQGKVVASRSSGAESITYSVGGGGQTTALDAAISDPAARQRVISDVIRKYLSGVTDANGVNLLYMGRYPDVP